MQPVGNRRAHARQSLQPALDRPGPHLQSVHQRGELANEFAALAAERRHSEDRDRSERAQGRHGQQKDGGRPPHAPRLDEVHHRVEHVGQTHRDEEGRENPARRRNDPEEGDTPECQDQRGDAVAVPVGVEGDPRQREDDRGSEDVPRREEEGAHREDRERGPQRVRAHLGPEG